MKNSKLKPKEKEKKQLIKKGIRAIRRKINRWTVVLFVVCCAFVMILYVSNVIYTDGLLKQIQEQKKELDILTDANDIMRSRIGALSSPERISDIAERKLGLIRQQQAPRMISNKKK